MEYFDVVNKNKTKTGKVLLRGSKLEPGEFNVGVEVWIINSNKKILLTQRSQLKSHPLQWECPGGCLVSGENSESAAVRELKEEIGLDINLQDLKYLSTHLYKYQFVDIYLLKKDIIIEKLSLQKEEVADVNWFSIEDFLELYNKNQIVPSVYVRYNLIKENLI